MNWGYHCGAFVAVDAKAALSWDFDQLRGRAGWRSQGHMAGTEGYTPHCAVYTGALVFTSCTEVLPILIHASVIFTGAAICLCPADAMGAPHIVAVVTLQAFVVVAGLPLVAVLVELCCTHFTAATAIRD